MNYDMYDSSSLPIAFVNADYAIMFSTGDCVPLEKEIHTTGRKCQQVKIMWSVVCQVRCVPFQQNGVSIQICMLNGLHKTNLK